LSSYRLALFIALLTLLLLPIASESLGAEAIHFYIYGSYRCPHCSRLEQLLTQWYGESSVFFCSVDRNATCAKRFYVLSHRLNLGYAVPLTLVINENRVVAIVLGEVGEKGFWDRLLERRPSNSIPLYIANQFVGSIEVENITAFTLSVAPEVVEVPQQPVEIGVEVAPKTLIPLLLGLALADAVNPCTIYIYVLLLIATALAASTESYPDVVRDARCCYNANALPSSRGWRVRGVVKRVALCGLAFTLAIYVGYMALGLGLAKVLGLLTLDLRLLALIAIAFGLWTIVSAALRKSRVVGRGTVLNILSRAAASPLLSFGLGLLLTFTLLPCSAGPYVVFLGLLSPYSLTVLIPYLALYNLIFVSPLLAILLAMIVTTRFERVQRVVVENSSTLSAIAGALLIAIGLYLAFH